MIASFSDYVPLADLGKIVAVCLVVAVIAPSAVSLAIAGQDRRAHSAERHTSPLAGVALLVLGIAIVCGLIAVGLYALFTD